VIYSGLWQNVEAVAQAAQDEDVTWVGISILNGAHMTLVPRVLAALDNRGMAHVAVIVGGIIPPGDEEKLKQLGVRACFGPGASIEATVRFLQTGKDSTE
jgi:methylmalonyl-CoA mutase cobalamin-binding domain/chain